MSTPAVIQAFLDRNAQCFLDDDYEGLRDMVLLPLTMTTRAGTITYRTEGELAADFDRYVAQLGLYMVTDITREVLSVDTINPQLVAARYSTEMWSGSRQVVEAYPSTAMLHFTRGAWRASLMIGAMGSQSWSGEDQRCDCNVVPFKLVRHA
ncbi:MAG: hypothetical protein AAFO93_06075 [Pseudomonadota bacterium]